MNSVPTHRSIKPQQYYAPSVSYRPTPDVQVIMEKGLAAGISKSDLIRWCILEAGEPVIRRTMSDRKKAFEAKEDERPTLPSAVSSVRGKVFEAVEARVKTIRASRQKRHPLPPRPARAQAR
jgi:hypothetical protein